jgi:hypothetical protein
MEHSNEGADASIFQCTGESRGSRKGSRRGERKNSTGYGRERRNRINCGIEDTGEKERRKAKKGRTSELEL